MARCRRYLNRKMITIPWPEERYRYGDNKIYSHRRPVDKIEIDRTAPDDLITRGMTNDANEF